jgi:hypothetical protein
MPDNEAPIRAFYDHETDEPRATGRRRRQVADWGVGEDVFDRLPSRRFARADRRGDDTRERARQSAATARDDSVRHTEPERARQSAPTPRDDSVRYTELAARRARRRPAADWLEEVSPRPAAEPAAIVSGGAVEAEVESRRTIVIGGAVEDEIEPRRTIVIGGAVEDAIEPRRPVGGAVEEAIETRRTVVVGGSVDDEPALVADEPRPRRTIVIAGHPDKLPAPRPRRPPKTALERVGASPDRLAAYAVGLGLLLILIAVLTTGH